MVVPFGFSVGDFIAVGTLAWDVYKSCKGIPGSFNDISDEVLSLHAVLKEADETILRSPLAPQSQERLKRIYDGCQRALSDLQALVDKYESLGIQSKWTWDRIKWGTEDIVEIRSRLISNTTFLTAYIRWGSLFKYIKSQLMESLGTSQMRVEQKLDRFIRYVQQGKRAPSVASTVDSLDPDDKEAWRTIRKELQDIGISIQAFDANKDFIFEKISNAVNTGEFQEQAVSDTGEFQEQTVSNTGELREQAVSSPSGSMHALDILSSTSSLSSLRVQESNQIVISDTKPPEASKATTKPTQAEQASTGTSIAAEPRPNVPTKVPRVAALIATMTRSKKRLIDAVKENDVSRIKNFLRDPSIDRPALNTALQNASPASSKEAYALLIDAGACINKGRHISRPLTRAVDFGKQDLVAFLLDKGADVNYQTSYGEAGTSGLLAGSSALRAAITRRDKAMITFLSQRGADINAVQLISSSDLSFMLGRGYPTGIHQASAQGNTSIVDLLINLGANFTDSQNGYGTPLSLAIYEGHLETAQLLITMGADVNEVPFPLGQEKEQFRSTIHIAIFKTSPGMVELLLKSGVETDWHEAYDCAKRVHGRFSNIRRRNNDVEHTRQVEQERDNILAVLRLIKAKKAGNE